MPPSPVILLLAFIMPDNQPDIRYRLPYSSIEECFADAEDFVKHGVPKIVIDKGAIAALAGCRVAVPEGEDG